MVITTDGSISSIPRDEYEEAEERVISELKELNKPFMVLMNCIEPQSHEATQLCTVLTEKYSVPVIPVNCLELTEEEITDILSDILYEFLVSSVGIGFPSWMNNLKKDNYLKFSLFSSIKQNAENIGSIRSISAFADGIKENEYIESVFVNSLDLSNGRVDIKLYVDNSYFYKILSEKAMLKSRTKKTLCFNLLSLWV